MTMTMFGSLVQRLTSPVTSPAIARRRFKSPSRWEVQSEPEDEAGPAGLSQHVSRITGGAARKSRAAKHLLDKRKSKSRARGLNVSEPQPCSWQDTAFFPLRGTKSLGRLDGMKEVGILPPFFLYLFSYFLLFPLPERVSGIRASDSARCK